MAVRIGINPITWSNDDLPSLGGDTPLETCLAEARQAGLAGIEMGGKFPKDAATLKPLMKRHDLALVSGWFSGLIHERDVDAEWDAVLPHLTLLRDLGSTHVVYADTSGRTESSLWDPPSQRPRLRDDEWKGYGRKLTALAERMADFGVGMAFHYHMVTIVETEADVDRMMANTGPAVGLLFDSGHCVFSGGDPVALLRRHVGRVVHVHCKDIRRKIFERVKAEDTSFLKAILEGVFTVPGDGFIDFPALLRILNDAGYEGWLIVEAEQDPAKANPLKYATMGFQNLSRMAREAGFTVTR
jgi:inosose dehydratase